MFLRGETSLHQQTVLRTGKTDQTYVILSLHWPVYNIMSCCPTVTRCVTSCVLSNYPCKINCPVTATYDNHHWITSHGCVGQEFGQGWAEGHWAAFSQRGSWSRGYRRPRSCVGALAGRAGTRSSDTQLLQQDSAGNSPTAAQGSCTGSLGGSGSSRFVRPGPTHLSFWPCFGQRECGRSDGIPLLTPALRGRELPPSLLDPCHRHLNKPRRAGWRG